MAFERIVVDPARMGGLPAIRDTRVTVGMVLGQLAAGRTIDDVLADEIFDRAADDSRDVVTADSDFSALLAMRRATSPSVTHLHHVTGHQPQPPAELRTWSRVSPCR